MTPRATLSRLRAFLHALAAGLFLGTIGELLSVKHYGEPVRLIPFALCLLGLIVLAVAWFRPGRRVLLASTGLLTVIAASSLLGVYFHVEGNLELVHEVHRHPTTRQLVEAALTGRNPLLAPGTLAVAAVIALAALYARTGLESIGGKSIREPNASLGTVGAGSDSDRAVSRS